MNANNFLFQLWCNLFEGTLHWNELPRPLRGTGEDFLFLLEFAFVIVAHAQGAPVPTEPVVFNKFPSCECQQHQQPSYHAQHHCGHIPGLFLLIHCYVEHIYTNTMSPIHDYDQDQFHHQYNAGLQGVCGPTADLPLPACTQQLDWEVTLLTT